MTTDERKAGRVFVSSTCHDLIDVRAVLTKALCDAGLEPVMSDQPDSGFVNAGDTNSIETCLVNLRACEKCIVILSQRYGPSLQKAGFDDISATHLEYRTAIENNIPVLFYVRDRLEAECTLAGKQGKGFTPVWSNEKDFERLRAFIDAHRKLTITNRTNWFWPFTSAIDLAARVVADLGTTSARARLTLLARSGALPLFVLTGSRARNAPEAMWVSLTMGGSVPVAEGRVIAPDGTVLREFPSLAPPLTEQFRWTHSPSIALHVGHAAPAFRIEYALQSGERVTEYHALMPSLDENLRFYPAGNTLATHSLRGALAKPIHEYGLLRVPYEPINEALKADAHPQQ